MKIAASRCGTDKISLLVLSLHTLAVLWRARRHNDMTPSYLNHPDSPATATLTFHLTRQNKENVNLRLSSGVINCMCLEEEEDGNHLELSQNTVVLTFRALRWFHKRSPGVRCWSGSGSRRAARRGVRCDCPAASETSSPRGPLRYHQSCCCCRRPAG